MFSNYKLTTGYGLVVSHCGKIKQRHSGQVNVGGDGLIWNWNAKSQRRQVSVVVIDLSVPMQAITSLFTRTELADHPVINYQFSIFNYQLSMTGYQLSIIDFVVSLN